MALAPETNVVTEYLNLIKKNNITATKTIKLEYLIAILKNFIKKGENFDCQYIIDNNIAF